MALKLQVQVDPSPERVPGARRTVCSLAARREWTVQEVKEALEVEAGVPASEQRLLLGARHVELRGSESLETLPPGNVANLRLYRRPQENLKWLGRVAERGMLLCAASPAVKKDRQVALAAVSQSGRALQYLPATLRGDREIVLTAVAQDGYALRYASAEMRRDRSVVLAAVRQSGLALHFADEKLQKDREVVLAASEQDGRALQFAAEALRQDSEVQGLVAAPPKAGPLRKAARGRWSPRTRGLAPLRCSKRALGLSPRGCLRPEPRPAADA